MTTETFSECVISNSSPSLFLQLHSTAIGGFIRVSAGGIFPERRGVRGEGCWGIEFPPHGDRVPRVAGCSITSREGPTAT